MTEKEEAREKVVCLLCGCEMKLIKTSNNSEYFVCTNPVAENVINALSRHLMTINEYQVLSAGKKSKAELTQIMENRSWFLTTGDADVLEF